VLGLTAQQALISGTVAAGLMLVRAFCWTWRQRSLRKTLMALGDAQRKTELELEYERRQTLLGLCHPHQAAAHKALGGNQQKGPAA
jgi:hypothetical protein